MTRIKMQKFSRGSARGSDQRVKAVELLKRDTSRIYCGQVSGDRNSRSICADGRLMNREVENDEIVQVILANTSVRPPRGLERRDINGRVLKRRFFSDE